MSARTLAAIAIALAVLPVVLDVLTDLAFVTGTIFELTESPLDECARKTLSH